MIDLTGAAREPRLRLKQPGAAKHNDACNQHSLTDEYIVFQSAEASWWSH